MSRGEMLVHADNMPVIDRNFEAMLVWMDEEVMDLVGFSEERFNEIVTEYKKFVEPLGIPDVT